MRLRPRLTAYKLHISDLHAGSYIREQTGAFLETFIGPVTRVRLLGTVVNRYDNPEKKFVSLTLDDSTDTIHIKAWREDCEKLADYQTGVIIDVIGKVRKQEDGELFIVVEDVIRVEDVNVELLRELEIIELSQLMGDKTIAKKEPEAVPKIKPKPLPAIQPEKQPEKVVHPQKIEVDVKDELDIKEIVMQLIRTLDKGKGASYRDIVEQSAHIGEETVETTILDLLNEGIIYEPDPGHYKEL